ncbi:MAG: hypothetical protein HDQ96_12390 [Lachnospiraceae bacterium]|nr:hypothetical protein [Lachnospiraceae bacterium]
MKYECELIRDLLPLYHDNVCSRVSRSVVEEHLDECIQCKKIEEKLRNTVYDEKLLTEKESVIGAHTKKVRRKTFIAGACIAGILMIPVGVCLICNIAIGHSLDWFFIVLAALMVFASLTVVPLVVEERRGLYTLGTFTVSLLLLLLVCNIYSGGRWFFVASSAVLLGLSVVFLPFVVYQIRLPEPLTHQKGFLVMAVDTALLYGVVIIALFHSGAGRLYLLKGLMICTVCLLLPWGMFWVIRYAKANEFTKVGTCTVMTGVFCAFINDIIRLILEGRCRMGILNANLSCWNEKLTRKNEIDTFSANILLLTLLFSLAVGGGLIAAGVRKSKKRKDHER